MRKYTGKSVYGSVVVGKVSVPKRKTLAVKRIRVEDIETEKKRLEEAKRISVLQLCEIYRKALVKVGEANASIFEIHIMLVDDEDYNESIYSILESQRVNAEYAVAVTADNFAQMFAAMEDSYMRACRGREGHLRQADSKSSRRSTRYTHARGRGKRQRSMRP